MCFGTGETGNGANVRHPSLRTRAGMLAGSTIPSPRTATVVAATTVGLDWLELLPSADAQQLSASVCVRTRCDSAWCELPLCIAHSAPPAQHAMRASGDDIHPTQIAAFPAIRPNVSARAAKRRTNLITSLECSLAGRAVKPGDGPGGPGAPEASAEPGRQAPALSRTFHSSCTVAPH